ncbi:MAG TPA: hypothetical protein VL970_11315 [Candidatus Acidoferrales bacterium]|nr:hypothetical protein [Candidatus Acidoferrales bacterium]
MAVNFSWQRFGCAFLLTLSLPALAQQTVQYSKPVGPDRAGGASAARDVSHPVPGTFNAPTSLFDNEGPGFDTLPGGPQAIPLNPRSAQWQKFLDDRKDWALLTPQEILDVPTAESILGIDPSDEVKLSAEERFMRRQDKESQTLATNGMPRLDPALDRDNVLNDGQFRNVEDDHRIDVILNPSSSKVSDALANLKPADNDNLRTGPGLNPVDTTWASPFQAQVLDTKQTPAQLAEWERFRAMMEPTIPVSKPETSLLGPPSVSSHDLDFEGPLASKPVGQGYTSLQDSISKPTGLLPLPGNVMRPPPAKKAPLVQPPPWMPDSPQNTVFPQRQF